MSKIALSDRIGPPAAQAVATVRDRGTTRVIEVVGELDVASSPMLDAALAETLADAPETVVLDLNAVAFMDSTGVHLLIRAAARARERAIRLVVIEPEGPASQVLELCRLREHLPIVSAD